MSNDKNERKDQEKAPISKPEPETLHKTDPQENMEGPVSSVMQNIREEAEENDGQTKEEADKKKDQNT